MRKCLARNPIAPWIAATLGLALAPGSALPQVLPLENTDPKAVREYWTPERLAGARPLPTPAVDELAALAEAEEAFEREVAVIAGDGALPTVRVRPDLSQRFVPEPLEIEEAGTAQHGEPGDKAFGSAKAYFTSHRIVPRSANTVYPYRAIGKLFFTQPGVGNFICTAAVLGPRIVVTAGHCVHKGSGGQAGFFTNFRFAPGFDSGVVPYGYWDWEYVVVSTTWSQSGGSFPNAADYAVLEMEDELVSGVLRRLGDVTGYLGYVTGKLRPNHAHWVGYPSNFDGAQIMHFVEAKDFGAAPQNTVIYGSDMLGGSSGGPIIQDWGDNAAKVKWLGAVSYYQTPTSRKIEGASIPDSRFVSLLDTACAHRAGNC